MTTKMLMQYLPIVAVVGVVIIGYLVYMMWQRSKILKECNGKHWCEFFKRGGGTEDMLLPEHRGEIKTISDKAHSKSLKSGTFVEAPIGSIGKYYTFPQASFNAKWPPGKPASVQQTIKKTAWIENYPLPISFINPEEWLDNDYLSRLTAHLIDVSSDEAVARATQEMQKEVYADIKTVAQKLKWGEYTFYAACAAAVAGLAAAALTYLNGDNIIKLIKLLGRALGHTI